MPWVYKISLYLCCTELIVSMIILDFFVKIAFTSCPFRIQFGEFSLAKLNVYLLRF